MMLNHRNRILSVTAGLAIASLAIVGCSAAKAPSAGGSGAPSGERTLTVFHKWPEGAHADFFEKVIADFEAESGVKVEATAVQDDPYKERIRVLTGSQSLPDVYFVWPGAFGEQFFKAGLAEDMTDALSDGWGDSLIGAAVEAYTHEGSTYAVPISMSGKFFTYNKQLFADAGVEVPTTYEDLITVCETFRAANMTPISMGNNAMWPGVHYLTTLIGKYVPQEAMLLDFDPKTATYDHPGYVQALTTLGELSEKCFTPGANGISNDSAKAEIQTGVVPMYYGESNIFSMFRESNGASADVAANWDFFPFPDVAGAKGDQSSLTGAPDGFAINAKSANKDIAEEFLRFFTSKQVGALLLEMRDRPSAVIGAEEGVAEVLPQLTDALAYLNGVETFNIWLDTATEPQVGAAWLAAGQAAIDRSQSPADILASVKAASDALKK